MTTTLVEGVEEELLDASVGLTGVCRSETRNLGRDGVTARVGTGSRTQAAVFPRRGAPPANAGGRTWEPERSVTFAMTEPEVGY